MAAPPQGGEDRTGSESAGPSAGPSADTPTPPPPEATLYRPPHRPPPPRQERSTPSPSTLPPPSMPTGGSNMETLEERLKRVARDRKRKAEVHTEDGSREPTPEPAATAQGSTSASAATVGPSADVGNRDGQRKRSAEDEPDDPRLVGEGPEAELGSTDIEHECAKCNQKFRCHMKFISLVSGSHVVPSAYTAHIPVAESQVPLGTIHGKLGAAEHPTVKQSPI